MTGFQGTSPVPSSPSRKAFLNWHGEASLGGTPTPAEEAAFEAGVEWALEVSSQASRKGSDLRGRVIMVHRTLWPNELEREGIQDSNLQWPCLELDDGTLVLPPFPAHMLPEDTGPYFLGYKPRAPEGKRKVVFEVEVIHEQRIHAPQLADEGVPYPGREKPDHKEEPGA